MQRVFRKRRRPPLLLVILSFILITMWLFFLYISLTSVEQKVKTPITKTKENKEEKTTTTTTSIIIDINKEKQNTIIQQLIKLGYEREVNIKNNTKWNSIKNKTSCPLAPVGIPNIIYNNNNNNNKSPIAYLTCISNEKFVDGALVLGVSLRQTSLFLKNKLADLVVIITANRVSNISRQRLMHEGTFDYVFEVPSLATHISFNNNNNNKAIFIDTFDKIYMFNLTMYEKVIFMDADMIAVGNMDNLFSKPKLYSPNYVGAIGGKTYFQTGMLVIIPTQEIFNCLYYNFIKGIPPNGNRYIGGSARDGVLMRDIFKTNFYSIHTKYSRNLNPRYKFNIETLLEEEERGNNNNNNNNNNKVDIKAIHLRGTFKPWFDMKLPNLLKSLGKKEYGFTYLHWWNLYEEEIHKKSKYYKKALQMLQEDGVTPGSKPVIVDGIIFGENINHNNNNNNNKYISPLTHVWMQRHSQDAYIQLISSEDIKQRNQSLPFLQKIASPTFGLSCNEVCKQKSLRCSQEALYFSSLNDCNELKNIFQCKICEIGVYWRPHPGNDFPALEHVLPDSEVEQILINNNNNNNNNNINMKSNINGSLICRYNYLKDVRSLPNCSASFPFTRRYCPCIPV